MSLDIPNEHRNEIGFKLYETLSSKVSIENKPSDPEEKEKE